MIYLLAGCGVLVVYFLPDALVWILGKAQDVLEYYRDRNTV